MPGPVQRMAAPPVESLVLAVEKRDGGSGPALGDTEHRELAQIE